MESKGLEIYGWSSEKIESLLLDIQESLLIEEVKDIVLEENTEEVYAKVFVEGNNLSKKYEIKIRIPLEYPDTLPYCFELTDNLPKEGQEAGNRHVTTGHVKGFNPTIKGSFCMISPFRLMSLFKHYPMDIYNTINLLLINFLINQEYFDTHGEFIGGNGNTFGHAHEGLIQSFFEMFNVSNQDDIYELLLLGRDKRLSLGNDCFCGSGKPIHMCHRNIMWTSHNIDFNNQHILNLIEYFESK